MNILHRYDEGTAFEIVLTSACGEGRRTQYCEELEIENGSELVMKGNVVGLYNETFPTDPSRYVRLKPREDAHARINRVSRRTHEAVLQRALGAWTGAGHSVTSFMDEIRKKVQDD